MEICRICKNEYSEITETHTLTHGMTLQQYEEWFPYDDLDFYLIGQPIKWNYTAAHLIQGLQNLNKNVLCMYDSNFAKHNPPTEVLIALLPYAKTLILVDETGRDGEQYYSYTDFFKHKTVYIDASFSTNLLIDPKTFPLYYKSENDKQFDDVFSFPFCMEKRCVADYRTKDVNLSCVFGPTNLRRQEVLDYVLRMNIPNTFIGEIYDSVWGDWNKITDGKSSFRYYRMLGKCSMSFSVFGNNGENTARFFEILANRGVVISERLNIDMVHPFTDGETYIEYASMSEMDEKLRHYLNYPEQLEQIRTQGYEFASQYHTTEARASMILQKIDEVLP